MIASIILGVLIFGFAGWTIVRSVRLSKQGKCAGCASKSGCSMSSCGESSGLTSPQTAPRNGR